MTDSDAFATFDMSSFAESKLHESNIQVYETRTIYHIESNYTVVSFQFTFSNCHSALKLHESQYGNDDLTHAKNVTEWR